MVQILGAKKRGRPVVLKPNVGNSAVQVPTPLPKPTLQFPPVEKKVAVQIPPVEKKKVLEPKSIFQTSPVEKTVEGIWGYPIIYDSEEDSKHSSEGSIASTVGGSPAVGEVLGGSKRKIPSTPINTSQEEEETQKEAEEIPKLKKQKRLGSDVGELLPKPPTLKVEKEVEEEEQAPQFKRQKQIGSDVGQLLPKPTVQAEGEEEEIRKLRKRKQMTPSLREQLLQGKLDKKKKRVCFPVEPRQAAFSCYRMAPQQVYLYTLCKKCEKESALKVKLMCPSGKQLSGVVMCQKCLDKNIQLDFLLKQ
jgi:hypothetical protein